jgi:hypothetical protein
LRTRTDVVVARVQLPLDALASESSGGEPVPTVDRTTDDSTKGPS